LPEKILGILIPPLFEGAFLSFSERAGLSY